MSAPALATRLKFEPLRTLAFGSISGTYAAVGTAFAFPSRILYVYNSTDVLLTFSVWPNNELAPVDMFVLDTKSGIVIDETANRTDNAGTANLSQGSIVYVKGSPGAGAVYVSTVYGDNPTV